MLTSDHYRVLTPRQAEQLATALGEQPQTAAAVNALRWDIALAYVLGDPSQFSAAVVELTYLPAEPLVFAASATALWTLLQGIDGWGCVLAAPSLARELGSLITKQTNKTVRYYADIGYELHRPIDPMPNPAVRLLTLDDLPKLAQLTAEPVGMVLAKAGELVAAHLVAGALVDDNIVATANAESPHGCYAEIGIETQPEWRGHGLAAAAASLVAHSLQAAGRIPVWSTGEDNQASQRVAQKLGFAETFRRLYVIPKGD